MRIYNVIKVAEDTYIDETSRLTFPGMCWCLKVASVKGLDFKTKNKKGYPTYRNLAENIPEFNPEFLGATEVVKTAGLDFWWDTHDTESRLRAFRILKDIYKCSSKEFEY